jgi:Helix-hairpin-helix containing domain
MVFLHSNGVGTARAVRIFKTYGADAVQVMSENPYTARRRVRDSALDRRANVSAVLVSLCASEGPARPSPRLRL